MGSYNLIMLNDLFLNSNIFDACWYRERVGLPEASKTELIHHYLKNGHKGEVFPNPIFYAEYYISEVKKKLSIKLEKKDAFFHFCTQDSSRYLSCHPLFDVDFYLNTQTDVREAQVNPIIHYLDYGWREGRRFSGTFFIEDSEFMQDCPEDAIPLVYFSQLNLENYSKIKETLTKKHILFNEEFYRNTYLDRNNGNSPYDHYKKIGVNKGFWPHPLFNPKKYAQSSNITVNIDPLHHFLDQSDRFNCGLPTDLIDPHYYHEQVSNISHNGLDPLLHYMLFGWEKGINPNPLFHTNFYLTQINHDLEGYSDPLTHFLMKGVEYGAKPNRWFDTKFYTSQYPDSVAKEENPLSHYLRIGKNWPLLTGDSFYPKYYMAQYIGLKHIKHTPLEHFIRWGNENNFLPKPSNAFQEKFLTIDEYKNSVRKLDALRQHNDAKASVIIPVFNNFEFTLKCVESILSCSNKTAFEILIADDGSTDETKNFFSTLSFVKLIEFDRNVGFLKNCNRTVKFASGEYLVFLNNDTIVTDFWLDNLASTFDQIPNLGLVGSKLVYPNGILQESGGIVWSDSSAANYGRYDDPNQPNYNYARDVDYISGAAIMLPKMIWDDIGGFDERYSPAYYEDTDLAFSVRNNGFRVMVQPASTVIHCEGISSGTDITHGVKKYQKINAAKFRKKWANILEQHGDSGCFDLEIVDRLAKHNVLVIDAEIPTPDQDAGSVLAYHRLKSLSALGYRVTFIPTNLSGHTKYHRAIAKLGVKVLFKPYIESIKTFLEENGSLFQVVFLHRVNDGGSFIDMVKDSCPDAKIVFDLADLHYLRQLREASLLKAASATNDALKAALATKERELRIIKKSDTSILLSEVEKNEVEKNLGTFSYNMFPLTLDIPGRKNTFKERSGVAFVGGYRHPPNVDAIMYFVENIWPKVTKDIPEVLLYVIGSNAPGEILALESETVKVIGFVKDLGTYLDNVKVAIAPLRYGAGIKGKIGTYMSYGVPSVLTSVAAEGMALSNDREALIIDGDEETAHAIAKLYTDEGLWNRISDTALDFVHTNYSSEAGEWHLLKLLMNIGAPPFVQHCSSCGITGPINLAGPTQIRMMECQNCGSNTAERVMASLLKKTLPIRNKWISCQSLQNVLDDKMIPILMPLLFKNMFTIANETHQASHRLEGYSLVDLLDFDLEKLKSNAKSLAKSLQCWTLVIYQSNDREQFLAKTNAYHCLIECLEAEFSQISVSINIGPETNFSDVRIVRVWN